MRPSHQFLTEREAAQFLNISISTLRRWRWADKGPAYLRVGDILRYAQSALDKFIGDNTHNAGDENGQ